MSYVSNYFSCHIQPERLLYDDNECDVIAIAKFLVICKITMHLLQGI